MNNIEQIILSVLEANDGCALDNDIERKEVANALATELLQASLTELASYLHGTVPSSLFTNFCNELDINPTEVP